MGSLRKLAAVSLLFLLFVGCGDDNDDPVAPVTPEPTMTGTWDFEWTVGQSKLHGIWHITEADGTITGTMTSMTNDIAGTCTADGDVMIGATNGSHEYSIQGSVTADRTSFSGEITRIENSVGYLLTATKR